MKYSVLIIEREQKLGEHLKRFLKEDGYYVILANNEINAIHEMEEFDFDIVLTDISMPAEKDVVLEYINNRSLGTIIIVLTINASLQSAIAALRNGAYDYIAKPCSSKEIKQVLKRACEKIELQRRLLDATNQLKMLAITDSLTNIYNQRYFKSRLSEEFDRTKRYKHSLSCMMIDVDSFKKLNDTYGHLEGDNILKTVATVIKKSIRSSDLLARYGGDEFVLLLPQTPSDKALLLAERIQNAVSKTLSRQGKHKEQITLSLGISTLPHPDVEDGVELLDLADKALYLAKRGGRNRIEILAD